MKTTIQILTCKLITNVCKLFKKNGTVYPGSVALKMNGKVLESIKYPKYVIGVTGSSGKWSKGRSSKGTYRRRSCSGSSAR